MIFDDYDKQSFRRGAWYSFIYSIYYSNYDSRMREKRIRTSYIDKAKEYWHDVNKRFKKGNPPIELGVAPAYKWECNPKYCNFYQVCGGGYKEKGVEL